MWSRAKITAACTSAREAKAPALLGGGYAVQAEQLSMPDPSRRTDKAFALCVYSLVTPDGEALGGCLSIVEFWDFVQHWTARHTPAFASAEVSC